MLNLKTRIAMAAVAAALVVLAGVGESAAAGVCCSPVPATVTYARSYAAGRVAWTPSYGISSTCNPWVPGSCGYSVYRPVVAYSPLVRTAYSPVTTAFSPCPPAANCTTVLRTRQVPGQPVRNLFRILLPPYRPIAETVCYTPTVAACPSPCSTYYSGACGPCGASCVTCPSGSCTSCYTTASYSTVCDPCGIAAPSYSSGGCCPPAATTYGNGSAPAIDGNGTPSTYKQDSQSEPEIRLMPTPDETTDPATFQKPAAGEPESRTAMQPVRQAVSYRVVSLPGSAAPAAKIDFGGWRAAAE